MEEDQISIESQDGFQDDFLSCEADILVGGGSAGGGKSYALLLDALCYINVPGFNAVIFRRTTPQIRNAGSLWDTSQDLFPYFGAEPREYMLEWKFPKKSKIRFQHMEYENNKLDWQGSQIPYIGFDELTQFTLGQFLYMLSRNRSKTGIKPCIRATCNPDPDSWVADFLSWWIDQETGFPIPERAGRLRYFTVDKGAFVWGDTKQEVIDRCPHIFNSPEFKDAKPEDLVKSVTFIPGDIYGNKKLLEKNPQYLGSLLALPEEDQLRLLKGNWKIRQDGSSLFNFVKISDLFSNFVEDSPTRYISCDYARLGSNMCVIKSWVGLRVVRIVVFTKSRTTEAFNAIEKERERMKVPRSNVIVDEDGVGGGVVDLSNGEYVGFHANQQPFINPITGIKENYNNLKDQCYYQLADMVNAGQIAINLGSIEVDGVQTTDVKVGSDMISIEKLIKEDLRAIKKKIAKKDEKVQINSKEEQKNILAGRSPDFGDTLMMRMYFELDQAMVTEADVFV